jgi:hypothetical protein
LEAVKALYYRIGHMQPGFNWIDGPWPGKMAVLSSPRGGGLLDDEIHRWRLAGVDAVVSLLMEDEIVFLNLGAEAELIRKQGMQYLSFPIPDQCAPASREDTLQLVTRLGALLSQGKNVIVHCRGGVGRSPMIAACVLVTAGLTADEAFKKISDARGLPVPQMPEQRCWVEDFASLGKSNDSS